MAIFQLEIECDNDAFGETDSERSAEISRILLAVAASLNRAPATIDVGDYMRDANGNRVGYWKLTSDWPR